MTELGAILATLGRWGEWYVRSAVHDASGNELCREEGQDFICDFFMVLTKRD